MSTVYCHINKINNKKYIGITSSSIERRWGENGIGYKNSYFYEHGIEQFGWDNFEHIILTDDVSAELAEQIEARLIKNLDTTNKEFGYNEANGAIIKANKNADTLAERYFKKIQANPKDINENIPMVGYTCQSNTYNIAYIKDLADRGQLSTELDCQRGYVWTEERQQGMWDTLLRGHRIPECQAVLSSRQGFPLYEIIDGKQRITTILNIVNNKIPFKKNGADSIYSPLFKDNKIIYFKELPKELQTRILTTNINFALYSNLTDNDLVVLFRKLNASMPLSEFSKSIACYVTMRTKFTRFLIKHPTIKGLFTEKEAEKSEDEKFAIRLMYLLRYGIGEVDLQPKNMPQKFTDFSPLDLTKYCDIITDALTKYGSCVNYLKRLQSPASFLHLIFYYFIKNNISGSRAENFAKIFKPQEVHGTGGEKKYQQPRYDEIDKCFKDNNI